MFILGDNHGVWSTVLLTGKKVAQVYVAEQIQNGKWQVAM